MKTIGLLGGMTYHSTLLYYAKINARVQERLGGNHAASMILHSFDFAEMATLFGAKRWADAAMKFTDAGKHMKDAGAEGIAIGCNIGHRVAPDIETSIGLPVLHIATFTARAVREQKLGTIALLATRSAMEEDFFSRPLREQAGVKVLVPETADREAIDRAIFTELGTGSVTQETKEMMTRVVNDLVRKGAEGVVLACTDLQMVLKPEDVSVPLLDTLEMHAAGLADWALET